MNRLDRLRRKRGTLAAEDQDGGPDSEDGQGYPLSKGERTNERLFVFSEKFDDEARCRVEDHVQADDLSRGVILSGAAVKQGEDEEVRCRFVQLNGMKSFVERDGSGEVGAKANAPGEGTFFAPTAAGGEAAEPSDSLADSDAGSEHIHGSENRQLLFSDIEEGGQESSNEAAVKDSGGLQGAETKDLGGVAEVVAQIEENHEELRAEDTGHGAVDRQIGDFFSGQTSTAGKPQGRTEPGEKTERYEDAVRGDVKGADADEFGEHAITSSSALPGHAVRGPFYGAGSSIQTATGLRRP